MPITKSAEKALRQNLKRRKINLKLKNKMKDAVKDLNDLAEKAGKAGEGTAQDLQEKLRISYKAIDKAAKKGVIKKNAASRKKSRLAKKVNAAEKKKK